MPTVFLLSPARASGERARMLLRSKRSELGRRLREETAPLADVYVWLSALYFRGKLTYAQRFATPHASLPHALVIAPGLGLRPPSHPLAAKDLRALGKVDLDSREFVQPLLRDAEAIRQTYAGDTSIVLLGSIATGKYTTTLLDVFGERLLFPATFVGRGDMSRGGLMLRAARSGEELAYTPVAGATLHGARPPKLPKLERRATTWPCGAACAGASDPRGRARRTPASRR